MTGHSDHYLRPLVAGWLGKIDRAIQAKETFQSVADECMRFFTGPHDFMWDKDYKNRPYKDDEDQAFAPSFRTSCNKVFELVALFGPVLYNRNPVRRVTPRKQLDIPQDLIVDPQLAEQVSQLMAQVQGNPLLVQQNPALGGYLQQLQAQYQQQLQMLSGLRFQQQRGKSQDYARAQLMEMVLSYTPNELDLATHMQDAITEALVKGRGVMWCEPYLPADSNNLLIGSFYDTVDNLVIDPDAERIEDAKWIARRCTQDVTTVERQRGLPEGILGKGNLESAWAQGESKGNDLENAHRQEGRTQDQLVYWKIWSRLGMGARLTGMPDHLKAPLELFGDNCYLEVAKGVPFPLNLPTHAFNGSVDELRKLVAWPVPFWKDNRWPFQEIDFYRKPRSVWPISPIMPGLGELKFINWSMSFLANRIRTTCRDFIAVAKSAASEIKDRLIHSKDLTIIEVEAVQGSIQNVVQFLQQPQVNQDIWRILDAVLQMFDKRVGLSDLVYGMTSRQMRTAAEVQAKQQNISVRPDHMAQQVEKASTELARREGLAWRWLGEPQDVVQIVGPFGAQLWQSLVMDADVDKVARELEFRVEAGTARKPDNVRDAANMQEILPVLLPILQGHATVTGDTSQMNWVIDKWGKAIEQDMSGAMMGPRMPPAPPPMPAPPQQGPPEQQEQGPPRNPREAA